MTIKKIITLQNLLILLCSIVIVLIGYKGYQIQQKISWIAEADHLYAENKLVEAEALYTRAQNNKFLDYKEKEVAARLQELAPITTINSKLSSLNHAAQRATSKNDYDELIQTYEQFLEVRSTYMEPKGKYAPYYTQISQSLGISDHFVTYFKQFKEQFLAQADENLQRSNYTDESFKWNLLRLPGELFGGGKELKAQLLENFQSYDETKMNQLASENSYNNLYSNVLLMLKQYKEQEISAKWVTRGIEDIGLALLKKDVENNSYGSFAANAKQYESFAASADLNPSEVTKYIANSFKAMLKTAKKLTTNNEFQPAIDMYEQLSAYQDTSAEIKEVKMAWLIAEPIRLLPERQDEYVFASSGTDRFGSKLYVAAADQTNQIYYGRMNSTDSVQVLTYSDLPKSDLIQSMVIDKDFSLTSAPVLLIQSASDRRNAIYTALEVQSDKISLLYRIEADEININPDGTLTVINPVGEGEGQTTIYEHNGDSYQFAKVQVNITDIDGSLLTEFPGIKVRFTCTVFEPGSGEVIALVANNYILLSGNFNFNDGDITVTGTFTQFRDVDLFGELTSIPVLEVEAVQ